MSELKINEQSIRTELKSFEDKPYKCLFEYVWNSFDAGASIVRIDYDIPLEGIGFVDNLRICDNGKGWDFTNQNAETFLSSSKSKINAHYKTLPKGKFGRGRYVFIWVAEEIEILSQNKQIILNHSTHIHNGLTTNEISGTEIHFRNIYQNLSDSLLFVEALFKEFLFEFSWFLESNTNFEIIINGIKLDSQGNVKYERVITKNDIPEELVKDVDSDIEIRIILWDEKPSEFSKFYFLDNNQSEIFKLNTGFNKKRDDFWHSVYIRSPLFNKMIINDENHNGQFSFEFGNPKIKRLQKKLIEYIKELLASVRKPYLVQQSEELLDELKEDNILPKLHDFGIYDADSYGDLIKTIYTITPSLFTGKGVSEKKFICATFAGLLSTQDDILIKTILEQLQELTEDEKSELLDILNRTSLSSVVKTIKEIDHRLDVISKLKFLITDLEKETLEVKHLQKIIDQNFWLFGEQFRLFSSTEGALKKVLFQYANEILGIEEPELNTAPNGEVDLFLTKTEMVGENIQKNVIVELKRASKKLSHKNEYQQIDDYRTKILEQNICNGENQYWEFYLIGKNFDDRIQELIETNKHHGEAHKGLTMNVKNGKVKMYVRKWSDILEVEWGTKMRYLKEKLEIQSSEFDKSSTDDIVDGILK
ncbi:ATP-binding protein [Maribacter litoralis]|uniref:Histidine kinase-, DNA gyrase B-, and HSP90-like ATPase n=1 Tax=Maribacter litoralis TaxID=2059726 RepID=A0A653NKA6_9FLAO|nr:ATP-binding protein [Maribacter litoralis]VXB17408.1 conserved hypothetical protein [Maribacter litoralis]